MNEMTIVCRLLRKTWKVIFTILDDETQAPIQGAAVSLTAPGGLVGTITTGSDGVASFSGLKKATFTYEVTHADFEDYAGSFVIPPAP